MSPLTEIWESYNHNLSNQKLMVQPGANILNAGQDLMSGKMVSPSPSMPL